jgi:hypothetical protein
VNPKVSRHWRIPRIGKKEKSLNTIEEPIMRKANIFMY